MEQQIRTFEVLFPHIKEDGVYLCEDCHTSYWKKFGGGLKRKGTFIEFAKDLIDNINAWHSNTQRLEVTDLTRTIKSLHFYDSIVAIEKGVVTAPLFLKTGEMQVPNYHPPKRWDKLLTDKLKVLFK